MEGKNSKGRLVTMHRTLITTVNIRGFVCILHFASLSAFMISLILPEVQQKRVYSSFSIDRLHLKGFPAREQ